MENETVWLTQAQIADLFQVAKQNISYHITSIFKEKELDFKSVVKKSFTPAPDGKEYLTKLYNLDVIISVGYRVKSTRGTQFRIWATQKLIEYIVKGFALNDDVLKKAGGGDYFEELLERIRDIRSSEKVFYRKVLDIYSTSVDYKPDAETSKRFFQTVQNKMHWAVHGQTAPELIAHRANAEKPFMGLTSFTDGKPRRADVTVAKNYLSHDELQMLNRMVSAYLDFAELQAMNRRPMYMKDWIAKLDDFLRMSEFDILKHAGTVSKEDADKAALCEYEKYREKAREELSEVERHFLLSIEDAARKIKGSGEKK